MFGFFLTESETLGLVYVVDITVKTYKVDFKSLGRQVIQFVALQLVEQVGFRFRRPSYIVLRLLWYCYR